MKLEAALWEWGGAMSVAPWLWEKEQGNQREWGGRHPDHINEN